MLLPNRPQPLPQPTRKPAPGAPMSAPLPMSRAAAISKARIQAAANAAAGMPVPSAAYVPTSADLAASVRLAASGQLVHGASSLPHSAFFLQDPFLSGNSSLASTIYTPNGTQDMQVRSHDFPRTTSILQDMHAWSHEHMPSPFDVSLLRRQLGAAVVPDTESKQAKLTRSIKLSPAR